MPFSWGAAARGGSDALEQLLAERYAKTQEAERVAREIAREQRAAEQWQQTMAQNQALFKANQEQQGLENEWRRGDITRRTAEDARTAAERAQTASRAANALGLTQRAIAGRQAGTLTPRQAALEAAGQGFELPEVVTTDPEQDEKDRLARLRGELTVRKEFERPPAGPQRNIVTLYKIKPGGGIENIDVTEGPEANQRYAQGWTKTAPKETTDASVEAKDTAQEVQRLSGELAGHKGFGGTFGKYSSMNPTFTSSQDTVDARKILGSLQGLLTLENMGKMKGVLSDSDMQILRQASTTLATEISEAAARKELNRLGRVMSKVTGEAWTDLDGPATETPSRRLTPTRRSTDRADPRDPLLDELLK